MSKKDEPVFSDYMTVLGMLTFAVGIAAILIYAFGLITPVFLEFVEQDSFEEGHWECSGQTRVIGKKFCIETYGNDVFLITGTRIDSKGIWEENRTEITRELQIVL